VLATGADTEATVVVPEVVALPGLVLIVIAEAVAAETAPTVFVRPVGVVLDVRETPFTVTASTPV
jgi:hypothetical protein